MASQSDEKLKKALTVEARARNISQNVRCTECGSQSIEDSQADVAILLRKLIRDQIGAGKTDKEIYKKLEEDFGETVLYAPKLDLQTAALWLSPVIVAGTAASMWAYQKHRQKTNVHIMALNLVRGVPLTPREKETMLDLLTPPPPPPRRSSPPFSTAAITSAASQAPMLTPPMHHQPTTLETPIGNPWSTGLFDCQEHDTNAVITAFFPCVTFGQIAEILDGGQTSCIMGSLMYILMAPALCSCWIISSGYRRKLRQMYNLVEAPAEDWTVHLFCPCCSLCQEFRELKNRWTDPSLGWMGNLTLQRISAAVTSTVATSIWSPILLFLLLSVDWIRIFCCVGFHESNTSFVLLYDQLAV